MFAKNNNFSTVLSIPSDKTELIIIIDGSNVVINTVVEEYEHLGWSREYLRKSDYTRLLFLIGYIKETIEKSAPDTSYMINILFDRKTFEYLFKRTNHGNILPEEISLKVYIELTKNYHNLKNGIFDELKDIPCTIKKCPYKADDFIISYALKHRNSIVITNDFGIKAKLEDKSSDLCNFMLYSYGNNHEKTKFFEVHIPGLADCVKKILEASKNKDTDLEFKM